MFSEESLGIIGSIASIISVIGAAFSWNRAKKAKTYSEIYYTTNTKENLQTVFVRLESIQELSYKLNSEDKRGVNKNKEIREYEDLRQKFINLINIIPSDYSLILTRLNSIIENIDSNIQRKEVMDAQALTNLKASINVCLGDIKHKLEELREDLLELQNK